MAHKPKKVSSNGQLRCINCDKSTNRVCRMCGQGICGRCCSSDGVCSSCQEDKLDAMEEIYERHEN